MDYRRKVDESMEKHELDNIRLSAERGYGKYVKSRPAASEHSTARAEEEIPVHLAVHPIIAEKGLYKLTDEERKSENRLDALLGGISKRNGPLSDAMKLGIKGFERLEKREQEREARRAMAKPDHKQKPRYDEALASKFDKISSAKDADTFFFGIPNNVVPNKVEGSSGQDSHNDESIHQTAQLKDVFLQMPEDQYVDPRNPFGNTKKRIQRFEGFRDTRDTASSAKKGNHRFQILWNSRKNRFVKRFHEPNSFSAEHYRPHLFQEWGKSHGKGNGNFPRTDNPDTVQNAGHSTGHENDDPDAHRRKPAMENFRQKNNKHVGSAEERMKVSMGLNGHLSKKGRRTARIAEAMNQADRRMEKKREMRRGRRTIKTADGRSHGVPGYGKTRLRRNMRASSMMNVKRPAIRKGKLGKRTERRRTKMF